MTSEREGSVAREAIPGDRRAWIVRLGQLRVHLLDNARSTEETAT